MKVLYGVLGLFFATSVNAQQVRIIDVIPKTNVVYGNSKTQGQYLSTDTGQISALFDWQNLQIYLDPKTTLVLTKAESCVNGGRRSFWTILSGSIAVKASRFSNPCSSAWFSTSRGITKITGTKVYIQRQRQRDFVGIEQGSAILSNDFGELTIQHSEYGILEKDKAPSGPFSVNWNDLAYMRTRRDQWTMFAPNGWIIDKLRVAAPSGETRNCKLLAHGYLRCLPLK